MLTEPAPVVSTDDKIHDSLANAAKISHMVNETTIGTISRMHSSVPVEAAPTKTNNDPWKRDVWRKVDLEAERKYSCTTINLMDCRAIQNKLALRNAEKIRQKQVRMEMAQRQDRINELENMMENMRLTNLQNSARKLQKNLLQKEEQIVQLVEQMQKNAQLAEEQAKREVEEHSKKMAEKIHRLKRVEEVRGHFQAIKSLKDLFIVIFEKFVKTCISNQQKLKNFQNYIEARERYLQRYENLIKTVNSGTITSAEVETLEAICDEVKEMQRSVDEAIQSAEEMERTIADRNEKLKLEQDKQLQQQQLEQQELQQKHQQQQELQQQPQPQPQQQVQHNVDTTDQPNPNPAPPFNVSNEFVSDESFRHYRSTMEFYERYAEAVKPLQSDASLKKFRFDLLKCVNLLSNSISSVSPRHLHDKFDRFVLMLSGNSVEIGGTRVSPREHPLGVRYVNLLVAKTFVKQADMSMALLNANPHPIASLILALWQKFPDFGSLFLAYCYKQSPLLVPFHIQPNQGQSTEDYLKSLGYAFKNNECEGKVDFLKRLTGLVRLYASVIIAKSRRSNDKPHPHGTEFAWIWIANELNLKPIDEDASATMLYEFLSITGSVLWSNYRRQFVKLLELIKTGYIANLNESNLGGPKTRLVNLVTKILQENKCDPPADVLPENFCKLDQRIAKSFVEYYIEFCLRVTNGPFPGTHILKATEFLYQSKRTWPEYIQF